MAKKKPLEIDMAAGSQLMDTQGETLSIEGADITKLMSGEGRFNDNHGSGFFNSLGRVTEAKKIFGPEDCTDPRHTYYWEKLKAPYIYCRGVLYDDEDHPNARAAAAILRNIHKAVSPLKLKASVEGGVVQRGIKDPSLLARTKIHSVALTFTPANNATLVEPINLDKTEIDTAADFALIKSVMHLAQEDVPSFRSITRDAQAEKVMENLVKMQQIAAQLGITVDIDVSDKGELIQKSIETKIADNVVKINELMKTLTAGYGGAGVPTNLTGGGVFQAESIEGSRGFNYITCHHCGKEQIYHDKQVKYRCCGRSIPFEDLFYAISKK